MKAFYATAAVGLGLGLSLLGSFGQASAQPYGGRDYGYGERDSRDRDYGRRGHDDDRDREDRYRERGRGYGGGAAAFDEREYLRCNPDVRRAIANGQMESAIAHYKAFGRRERRRLSC